MAKKTIIRTETGVKVEIETVSPQLAALAAEIASEHAAAIAAVKRGIDHAMAAGDLLRQAKAACGHGQWLPYLAQCAIKERTAQFYMWLARHRPAIEEAKRQEVDLTLRNVRALLAASSTAAAPRPPEIRPDASPAQVIELPKKSGAPVKEDAVAVAPGARPAGARSTIEALTKGLNQGGSPAPAAGPKDDDDLIEYLAVLLTESARDAGANADVLRSLLADAATCAPVFRQPQRWRDVLRAQDEMIEDPAASK